jgi:hypothetical protein
MARAFLPGLELARQFYAEVVAPLLDSALAGAPYSAALLGWGSDVQGFDTGLLDRNYVDRRLCYIASRALAGNM